MGYHIHVSEAKFTMSAINVESALAALEKGKGSYCSPWAAIYGGNDHNHYFCTPIKDYCSLTPASRLEQLLLCVWGWDITIQRSYRNSELLPTENITGITFALENSNNEEEALQLIAPYVDAGSYIVMCGQDGEKWRYYFDGQLCKKQVAKIVWE